MTPPKLQSTHITTGTLQVFSCISLRFIPLMLILLGTCLAKEAIPEFHGYKNVTIRSVEPDGIRIIHDDGVTKIPIEILTPDERERYLLNIENAREHRKTMAEKAAAETAALEKASAEARQAPSRTQNEQPRPNTRTSTQSGSSVETSQGPRYVTRDQIKVYWYKQLPNPRRLDPNYHDALKARTAFVEQIRAGAHDLAAEKTAAQYNKQEALAFGDHERARFCETELARITQQEAEAQRHADAQAALQEARRARMQSAAMSAQMQSLKSDLDRLNRDITSIRMSVW